MRELEWILRDIATGDIKFSSVVDIEWDITDFSLVKFKSDLSCNEVINKKFLNDKELKNQFEIKFLFEKYKEMATHNLKQ